MSNFFVAAAILAACHGASDSFPSAAKQGLSQ